MKDSGFLPSNNRNLTYLFRNNELCIQEIQKCARFPIYRIKFEIQRESQNKKQREEASKQKMTPHLLFIPDYPQYHVLCTWKLHKMPFYLFIYVCITFLLADI